MGFINRLLGLEPSIIKQIGHGLKNGCDTGETGEWLSEYMINNGFIKGHFKTLRNIYVPHKGRTSEIDVLIIHEKGIFVLESKNYSGWIFGSENQGYWTQSLPNRQKNKFYNPIKQNRTHITALSNFLELDKDKFMSFIVFSERCELKKVPPDTEEYLIFRRHLLHKKLRLYLEKKDNIFSSEQVDEIAAKLQPLTEVSDEVKQEHVDDINARFNKDKNPNISRVK